MISPSKVTRRCAVLWNKTYDAFLVNIIVDFWKDVKDFVNRLLRHGKESIIQSKIDQWELMNSPIDI